MLDLSAVAKWPNVPACYDWLSLDRRGHWRLQGERVTHAGLLAFINRQYGVDEAGNWFMQNGPQRVFVSLACTPWIFRLGGDAGLLSQTGQPAGAVKAVYLDEDGNLLLETTLGIGLLDDRDLASVLAQCVDDAGNSTDEAAFLDLMVGQPSTAIFWQGCQLQTIAAVDVAKRFKFNPQPTPL